MPTAFLVNSFGSIDLSIQRRPGQTDDRATTPERFQSQDTDPALSWVKRRGALRLRRQLGKCSSPARSCQPTSQPARSQLASSQSRYGINYSIKALLARPKFKMRPAGIMDDKCIAWKVRAHAGALVYPTGHRRGRTIWEWIRACVTHFGSDFNISMPRPRSRSASRPVGRSGLPGLCGRRRSWRMRFSDFTNAVLPSFPEDRLATQRLRQGTVSRQGEIRGKHRSFGAAGLLFST